LRDAYSNITLEELVRKKVASLEFVVGPPAFLALSVQAATAGLDGEQRYALRVWQFFHVVAALGVLALAPLAWLFPRAWRSREFGVSLRLAAIGAMTVAVWVLVSFDLAVIHAGSLAVMCFLYVAAMLAFAAVSRWLAVAAFALHAVLTIDTYGNQAPLFRGAQAGDYFAFNALAVVAIAITCALLWKLSSSSNGNNHEPARP